MGSAYSAFPNQGIRMRPYFVPKATDRDGNLLEETHPKAASAIRADTAYIITSRLQGVLQRSTAATAARLARPLAGKTGTTNDYTDAWFIGFDPGLAAGVWMGYGQEKPQGRRGGGGRGARAPPPPWTEFMEAVRADTREGVLFIPPNSVVGAGARHTGYP